MNCLHQVLDSASNDLIDRFRDGQLANKLVRLRAENVFYISNVSGKTLSDASCSELRQQLLEYLHTKT
ncbi:hypothetical protein OAI75_03690 [Woeseiaceae bacterium]|nr:hypothetical protein [Woeseiaceae bacterium]